MDRVPSIARGLAIITGTLLSIAVVAPVFAQLSVDVRCSELRTGTYPDVSTCGLPALDSSSGDYSAGALYQAPVFAGSDGGNSYRADAAARADYGTLGVFAFAQAANTPFGDTATRTMQLLASARSQWIDTYTLGGASGTLVDIRVDLAVHFSDLSHAASDGMLSTGLALFQTTFSDTSASWCWLQGAVGACGGAAPLGEGFTYINFTAQLPAGTSSTWQSSLYAEAQIYEAAVGAGEVNIAALNTVHTYFTVLTEGATLEWASGNTYSAPVPEPETYVMLLVGLGMLGWVGRRRK